MTYDVQTPAGARLWPYHPDWSGGFETTRSFRTDIITSRSKFEQRRALRDVPRLSARYGTVVQESDLRAANHFFRARQNAPTAIPDFSRYALTTGSSSGGTDELTITSPPAWIAAGQLLVLCSASETELVEVDDVTGDTITLTDNLANAWPSGSVVRPGLFGLLDGQITAARFRRGAAKFSVLLSVYPGAEPPEDEGTAAATFNGYEVFPQIEPDWSGSPSLDHIWPVEQVDYGIGRTAQFRPIDRAADITEAQFNVGAADARTIEQAFLRMKGRRGAFYRPSTEKDFDLAAPALSGSSAFLASGPDLAADFGSVDYGANPIAIEVVLTSGTRLRKLITGITASTGNSLVAVGGAWGTALSTANVARISWMPLVRFTSDDLTTAWRTPTSATIRLGFQGIKA